jgi:Glycosyltransferase family 87
VFGQAAAVASEAHIKVRERIIRGVAVLFVLSLLIGFVILSFPQRMNGLDFSEYYSAGQIIRQGLGRQLYDLKVQLNFQLRIAQPHVFYNHPPFEALLFAPFTRLSYRAAYISWVLFSVGLLVCAAAIIEANTGVILAVSQYIRMQSDFGLVLLLFMTFAPVTTCLLLGQDSPLLLLIYTVAFVLLRHRKEFLAGCVLAGGLFKFHLIVPFVLVLVLCRKWSFVQGFALVGALLILVSIAISGPAVLSEYPKFLLLNPMYQQVGGFAPEYMPNIRGFVHLLLNGKLAVISALLVMGGSVAVIGLAAKNWNDEQFGFSFSAAILAVLLASYHLYDYDLTLLLLPISILCGELARQGRAPFRPVLLVALIAFFVPPLHHLLLRYSIYALMFVPILLLLIEAVRVNQTDTPGAARIAAT